MECDICYSTCDELVSSYSCHHKVCKSCDDELAKRHITCPWCRSKRVNNHQAYPKITKVRLVLSGRSVTIVSNDSNDSSESQTFQTLLSDHRQTVNTVIQQIIEEVLQPQRETESF